MISSEECFKHAARCASMAVVSRDPDQMSHWRTMAERWISRATSQQRRERRDDGDLAGILRRNRAIMLKAS
jgi:hypothetical protein